MGPQELCVEKMDDDEADRHGFGYLCFTLLNQDFLGRLRGQKE